MSNNSTQVLPIEKIISVISYLTMGIIGLIWLIIARFMNRKTKHFLLYNITQSMVIAIILAIFKFCTDIIFLIISKIPFLDFIVAILNFVISIKIIRFQTLGFSFTLVELFIIILLLYICIGVILGRVFYVPFLTDFMQKIIRHEK